MGMQHGMTFQSYIWAMGAASVAAWIGWFVVVWRVDPAETGLLGLGLFYITLFASLVGTFAVAGVLYRVLVLKREQLVMREVRITFRHGLMLAFVAVFSLGLSAQNLLTWWNMLGIFACIGLVEYVFVSMEENRRM